MLDFIFHRKKDVGPNLRTSTGVLISTTFLRTTGRVKCPNPDCDRKYWMEADLHIPPSTRSQTIICKGCRTHFDMTATPSGELIKIRAAQP